MTDIFLPYGVDRRSVAVPDGVDVEYLAGADPTPLSNIDEAFEAACANPVGGVSLSDVRRGSRVVVLVADVTRSKGTEGLLPRCIAYLTRCGVEATGIRVIVARGTHRKMTREEKTFFKDALPGIAVGEHDCDATDTLSALMLTKRGTPVRVNAALKDADMIVLLSPVSFHYFAGFGGGRKLVMPGCADRSSIMANHRLSLRKTRPVKLHPKCRPGVLDGNPVNEDMCETLRALRGAVGINFFTDVDGRLVYVNTGDAIKAHREACEAYRRVRTVRLDTPYDVLVLSAGGYPYDINLLQAHKALRHGGEAVKEGGTILYYAECAEGVGSTSLEAALRQDRESYLESAYESYGLNNQTAVSLYDLTRRFEIGMVSAMNVDLLLAAGIKPCVNPDAFLGAALEASRSTRVGVLTHGSSVLPRID